MLYAGRMDLVGGLVEGNAACFAEEPAFVERDVRALVVGREMVNGLSGA